MNLNFLFAWRYFRSKKSTNAINIIAWISMLAITVGAAALILVLSVFNGFEDLVKSLYASFYPDLRIVPASGKQLTLSQAQLLSIRGLRGVQQLSMTMEEKALLQNGEYQSIVYLKGVDEDYGKVNDVADHIVKGEFRLGTTEYPLLVLGAGVENAVGVQSDRNLTPLLIHLPRKGVADLGNPLESVSADTVNTSGAFVIQQDFDNKYVLTNLGFMKEMMGVPENTYGAAEMRIDPAVDMDELKESIQAQLGQAYLVQTRYEQNKSLYAVMRAEKWVIYAILSLILVVAAFNMIGSLTMLVLEKKEDISVLHSLGASRRLIRNIFLSEGLLLALGGGGLGMLLATGMVLLQLKFKLIPLQGGSFIIDYFPVKLNPWDLLLVGATLFFIAIMASYIPARKAAQQSFRRSVD